MSMETLAPLSQVQMISESVTPITNRSEALTNPELSQEDIDTKFAQIVDAIDEDTPQELKAELEATPHTAKPYGAPEPGTNPQKFGHW